jgi:hypothetical protein
MFRKLDLFPSSGWETPTALSPLERLRLALSKGPNRVGVSHPEDGNSSSFRNIVFIRIPDDGQIPEAPVIPNYFPLYETVHLLTRGYFCVLHFVQTG